MEPNDDLFYQQTLRDFPKNVVLKHGTIVDITESFDAILYLDVLEHIADDRAEIKEALKRLKPGGFLIILVPAHQYLFSEFDEAVGHCRRYSLRTLRNAIGSELITVSERYLDSVGLIASLTNRLLLRQSSPSQRQVEFWDRVLVQLSNFLDPILRYKLGKSILAVYRKGGIELDCGSSGTP